MAGLFGALGAVALAFGLLSAVVAIFQPVADPLWIFFNLVSGVVLLGLAAVGSFDRVRERVRSGDARRIGRYGASALVGTLAGLVVLVLLAFLSTRYSARFDWSEGGVNTLTSQTQGVLARLDQDIAVEAFLHPQEVTSARELLRRYERSSDHFGLSFIDPLRRPDLVEAYELDERSLSSGLVRIALGEAALVVQEVDERSITNALLKLTQGQERKVYFVTGHNERSITTAAEEDKEGMARAADALRNETYQVEELVLASVGRIPADADAVVIAGPTRVYEEAEHRVLGAYVAQGGALLVMVDPRSRTDLYDDLAGWGVHLGDDVVVDQRNSLFTRPMTPFAASYSPEHPITKDLREVTLFDVARSVELAADVVDDFEVLVFTGEDSWAERDLVGWTQTGRAAYDDADLTGPVPLAVAGKPRVVDVAAIAGSEAPAEGDAAGPGGPSSPGDAVAAEGKTDDARLVVFGDSDFASNEYLDGFRNRDLFVNAVNWLVGDVEQISLRPNTSRASSFELSDTQFRRLQIISLFLLPEAIALAGVVVWWSRRQRAEA